MMRGDERFMGGHEAIRSDESYERAMRVMRCDERVMRDDEK